MRLNYLCEGYRAFFGHASDGIAGMANLLQRGMPATMVQRMSDMID